MDVVSAATESKSKVLFLSFSVVFIQMVDIPAIQHWSNSPKLCMLTDKKTASVDDEAITSLAEVIRSMSMQGNVWVDFCGRGRERAHSNCTLGSIKN